MLSQLSGLRTESCKRCTEGRQQRLELIVALGWKCGLPNRECKRQFRPVRPLGAEIVLHSFGGKGTAERDVANPQRGIRTILYRVTRGFLCEPFVMGSDIVFDAQQ